MMTQVETTHTDAERPNYRGCLLLFVVLAIIPSLLMLGTGILAFRPTIIGDPTLCEVYANAQTGVRLTVRRVQSGFDDYELQTFAYTANGGAAWDPVLTNRLRDVGDETCEDNVLFVADGLIAVYGGRALAVLAEGVWSSHDVCDPPLGDVIEDCEDETVLIEGLSLGDDGGGELIVGHDAARYRLVTEDAGRSWRLDDAP